MSFFQTHQGLASTQTLGVPLITSGIVSVLLSTTALLQWLRIRRLRNDLKDVAPSVFSCLQVDDESAVVDETEIPLIEGDAVIEKERTSHEDDVNEEHAVSGTDDNVATTAQTPSGVPSAVADKSVVADNTPVQVTEIEVMAVESPMPEQDQQLSHKVIVNEDTVGGTEDDIATADLKQTESAPTDEKAPELSVAVASKKNLQDGYEITDSAKKSKSINDNEVPEPEAMSFIEITKESIPSLNNTPPTSPVKVQIVDTEKLHDVSPVPSLPSTPLPSPSAPTKHILKLTQSTDETVTMTVSSDEMNEISAHSVPTPTTKGMDARDSKKYALDTSDMSVMSTITDASPTKRHKSKMKSFLKGAKKRVSSSFKKLPSITN